MVKWRVHAQKPGPKGSALHGSVSGRVCFSSSRGSKFCPLSSDTRSPTSLTVTNTPGAHEPQVRPQPHGLGRIGARRLRPGVLQQRILALPAILLLVDPQLHRSQPFHATSLSTWNLDFHRRLAKYMQNMVGKLNHAFALGTFNGVESGLKKELPSKQLPKTAKFMSSKEHGSTFMTNLCLSTRDGFIKLSHM